MKLKYIILFSVISLFTSCALKPMTSEYSFIKTEREKVNLDKLGDRIILIYNGADALNKIDNTARLNVCIDNRSLGQIRSSEYAVINFKNGEHQFKALYLEFVKMTSAHNVQIDKKTKFVKIKHINRY